tara:strand:- start:484 stop:597 length:114 start_codon:yes stop_codon:yes gene_type:complete
MARPSEETDEYTKKRITKIKCFTFTSVKKLLLRIKKN